MEIHNKKTRHSLKVLWPYLAVGTLSVLAVMGFRGTGHPQPERQRQNVLFICVDDLNNDLSIYGHPLVKSPNFERLASRSVQFDRAYCQYPLCNPSRASVMTGLRPDQTRIYDLETHFREHLPQVVTLPQLFKDHGYYTGRVGKVYHMGYAVSKWGTNWLDDSLSWREVVNPTGRDVTDHKKIRNLLDNRSFGYLAAEGTDEEQTDGKVATEAIRMLEENKDQPFFLAVGFFRPHTPFVAPQKYFDLYSLESIRLPTEPADDMDDIPQAALSTVPVNWGLSEADRKEAIRGYYATVTFMDAQVGRLLDALDRLKLQDNTIIVLWSDHGYNLGQHGQWMKMSLFENSARAPFLIAAPGLQKGKTSGRTVELLDIYPTLAELCGLPAPPKLAGKSLLPLLQKPNAPWDRPAYTQVARGAGKMGRSVRTERWRYTQWDGGAAGTELYDHQRDGREITNLAGKKQYAAVERQMARLLREGTVKNAAASVSREKL